MNYFFENELPSILTEEETQKYLKESKEGSKEARDKLIVHNTRLVLSIITKTYRKKYSFDNELLEELVTPGIFGLMKAIDNYDLSKNYKFSTYAATCINNEILMYLRKIKRQYNNGDISYEEMLEKNEFNIPAYSKRNMVQDYENKESLNEIIEIINNLNEEDKKLYQLYCVEKKGQKEIASLLNITQSGVSRKITKLMNKIKSEAIEKGIIEPERKKTK